ncbi:MAG: relaxase domain-containing protein [Acidimicrobiia bacterium]|nr:relaxase domain-containing protein [Acidimicrobiia bacterium]NNF08953.1 relaxase domain-containing protein [Acidimicrobiia bacterium]NNL71345.1 relaxase domain-containing protein [Acidimicrobiia bacterium]
MTVRVTTLKGVMAGRYYTEQLPSYYLDGGEPPGRWFGDGAAMLGLDREIDDEAFLAVMAGLQPTTGERLGRRFGETSVRGFDATFSAPKSVSVLFAVGDQQLRREVTEAHDRAVDAVLGWVESQAHTRMRRRGHVVCVDAEGIVAGVFRQHTSRRLDPQLHTHAVIANRVKAPDGRWLALDARTLKMDQRTLSGLYHAGLRAELTRRLGVRWHEPEHGIAEIADMDPKVLAEFSQRSREAERRVGEKLTRFRTDLDREPTPRERWRLEREAVLDSRPAKHHSPSAGGLHESWRTRATALGCEAHDLVASTVGRVRRAAGIDRATMADMVEGALEALGERQSTWRPAELVRELAAQVPTNVTVEPKRLCRFLQDLADHVTATRCVDLSPPIPDGAVRRRDGRPIREAAIDRALTTRAILDEEERIVEWAQQQRRLGGIIDTRPRDLDTQDLSVGQAEACRAAAGMAPLELIVGPAGSGKTTALTPAVTFLQNGGQTVFGVASTAAAAQVLGTETTMAADTLDKLLYEHTRPDRSPQPVYDLPQGSTVIVDEAGTVSTPQLAALTSLADQKAWRLVMVGDPRQFSAVGRGGMFAHLIDIHGATELDHVHRFTHQWERDATRRLRNGDVTVLKDYQHHGRLHDGTAHAIETAIIDAWSDARAGGESVALMANTNHTVNQLNQLAQQRRIDAHEFDPNGPALQLGRERLFIGDEVVTRRNQRTLRTDRGGMVKNRDHWRIVQIHSDGVTVTGRTGTVRLPADYVAEHIELGYAQTSHATQGRTVDVGLLLVDGPIDGRGIYTSLTRGRNANHAYVVTAEGDTAADVLTQAIVRDWVDQPAITRRTKLRINKALHPSLRSGGPSGHGLLDRHRPDSAEIINEPSSNDDQTWQSINRSIEAAGQRHFAERARSCDHRDIGH